jgi:hypothetical protein
MIKGGAHLAGASDLAITQTKSLSLAMQKEGSEYRKIASVWAAMKASLKAPK